MIKKVLDFANKAVNKLSQLLVVEKKKNIVIRTKKNNEWQYYSDSGKTTDLNKAKTYASMSDAFFAWQDIKNKDSYWAPSFITDKEVI